MKAQRVERIANRIAEALDRHRTIAGASAIAWCAVRDQSTKEELACLDAGPSQSSSAVGEAVESVCLLSIDDGTTRGVALSIYFLDARKKNGIGPMRITVTAAHRDAARAGENAMAAPTTEAPELARREVAFGELVSVVQMRAAVSEDLASYLRDSQAAILSSTAQLSSVVSSMAEGQKALASVSQEAVKAANRELDRTRKDLEREREKNARITAAFEELAGEYRKAVKTVEDRTGAAALLVSVVGKVLKQSGIFTGVMPGE